MTEGLEGLGNSDWNTIPRSLMAPDKQGPADMCMYIYIYICASAGMEDTANSSFQLSVFPCVCTSWFKEWWRKQSWPGVWREPRKYMKPVQNILKSPSPKRLKTVLPQCIAYKINRFQSSYEIPLWDARSVIYV